MVKLGGDDDVLRVQDVEKYLSKTLTAPESATQGKASGGQIVSNLGKMISTKFHRIHYLLKSIFESLKGASKEKNEIAWVNNEKVMNKLFKSINKLEAQISRRDVGSDTVDKVTRGIGEMKAVCDLLKKTGARQKVLESVEKGLDQLEKAATAAKAYITGTTQPGMEIQKKERVIQEKGLEIDVLRGMSDDLAQTNANAQQDLIKQQNLSRQNAEKVSQLNKEIATLKEGVARLKADQDKAIQQAVEKSAAELESARAVQEEATAMMEIAQALVQKYQGLEAKGLEANSTRINQTNLQDKEKAEAKVKELEGKVRTLDANLRAHQTQIAKLTDSNMIARQSANKEEATSLRLQAELKLTREELEKAKKSIATIEAQTQLKGGGAEEIGKQLDEAKAQLQKAHQERDAARANVKKLNKEWVANKKLKQEFFAPSHAQQLAKATSNIKRYETEIQELSAELNAQIAALLEDVHAVIDAAYYGHQQFEGSLGVYRGSKSTDNTRLRALNEEFIASRILRSTEVPRDSWVDNQLKQTKEACDLVKKGFNQAGLQVPEQIENKFKSIGAYTTNIVDIQQRIQKAKTRAKDARNVLKTLKEVGQEIDQFNEKFPPGKRTVTADDLDLLAKSSTFDLLAKSSIKGHGKKISNDAEFHRAKDQDFRSRLREALPKEKERIEEEQAKVEQEQLKQDIGSLMSHVIDSVYKELPGLEASLGKYFGGRSTENKRLRAIQKELNEHIKALNKEQIKALTDEATNLIYQGVKQMQEASPQEGVKSSDELAEIVDYIYRQIKDIED